jgi:hypothetical protein
LNDELDGGDGDQSGRELELQVKSPTAHSL